MDDAFGRAIRVDPPLIGDDAGALLHAGRQNSTHAVIEVGVITFKGGIAAGAYLRSRNCGFGHGLKAQIVEFAFLCIELCWLDAVAPPGCASTNADGFFHLDSF